MFRRRPTSPHARALRQTVSVFLEFDAGTGTDAGTDASAESSLAAAGLDDGLDEGDDDALYPSEVLRALRIALR